MPLSHQQPAATWPVRARHEDPLEAQTQTPDDRPTSHQQLTGLDPLDLQRKHRVQL